MKPRVGVVGASGYSGAVATRLVASHPLFDLVFATSDRLVGTSLEAHLGMPIARGISFEQNANAASLAAACDVVLLATSAEISAVLAPKLVAAGKPVIDFSGAFRLDRADAYPRWYKLEHPAPTWLGRAHYGLPEVFGPPARGEATIVANPGCYATAAILALAPLLRGRLIEPAGIVVDAKSGVSGAGRQATEGYSFVEVNEDVRAYKLLSHQHTPEIALALGKLDAAARLTFTPHLVPLQRGILATSYARPRQGTTPAHVAACLAEAYANTPFVRACPPEEAAVHRVAGTNLAYVGATSDQDVVVVVSVLDNLLKGAAGQAIQNLNLLFGFDQAAGLTHLQRFSP